MALWTLTSKTENSLSDVTRIGLHILAKYVATLADRMAKNKTRTTGLWIENRSQVSSKSADAFDQIQVFELWPNFWSHDPIRQYGTKQSYSTYCSLSSCQFRIFRVDCCRDIALWIFIRYRCCHILRGRCSRTKLKIENSHNRKLCALISIWERKSFDLAEICMTSGLLCGHMSKIVKNRVFFHLTTLIVGIKKKISK